ncbi:MAG TPA: sigma-70 family RNA polymerase sigma factor [Bryobacteraceae bacterium]|nr:sigma-70 family RNA polymerase sigma factor [Bryobacteraceae bacterium]
MDALLDPYLTATGDATEKLLEDLLVREAEPRIRKVILRKLGSDCPDLDDVCSEVLVQAASSLRDWKTFATECRVESFANYIAACSFNAASEYLRRKYPLWRRLRDRIHYILRHDSRLAIWQSGHGAWLCGLAAWKGQNSAEAIGAADRWYSARGLAPADSLHAVFQLAQAPLDFDALVDVVAELWGEPLDRVHAVPPHGPVAVSKIEEEIDQRRYAERLWAAIAELPVRQRQALLLHMNADGLDVFLLFGVVSFHTLADRLELGAAEFAELWPKLPLDDLAIAARLGMTRQQVINLRKSARKRLGNRVGANIPAHSASSETGAR